MLERIDKSDIQAEIELQTGRKHHWIDITAKRAFDDEEYDRIFESIITQEPFPHNGHIHNPTARKKLNEEF